MRYLVILVAALGLRAEEPTLGVLIGDVLERDGNVSQGSLMIRARDHRVHQCSFDAKTWFGRNGQRVSADTAKASDRVETVADRSTGGCYLRTVQLFEAERPRPASTFRVPRTRSPLIDLLAPRGNITFSAIVLRRTPEALVVRTRKEGEKILVLRQDTRYLSEGLAVEAGELAVNTRVFIRAGLNLDNQLEAFQVVWGQILNVR